MAAETSPAFQFYPKDFLTDGNVAGMTLEERGAYITLLCLCWQECSLPTDTKRLAQMVGLAPRPFLRLWPALESCFTERDGRLIQGRLEKERAKQVDYRRRQSEAGKASAAGRQPNSNRGSTTVQPDQQPEGNQNSTERQPEGNSSVFDLRSPISDLQSPISDLRSPISNSDGKNVSSEPAQNAGSAPPVEPPAMVFATVGTGPKMWALTNRQVQAWIDAYPAVDVMAECRKAGAWLEASPSRRKTANGMARFLVAWLGRTTDRGGHAPAAAAGKTAGNAAAIGDFIRRHVGTEP